MMLPLYGESWCKIQVGNRGDGLNFYSSLRCFFLLLLSFSSSENRAETISLLSEVTCHFQHGSP